VTSAPALSESSFALCLIFIALVPLAALGLALINTGLGRSRSAAHTMLTSLCVLAIAAIAYLVFGFAWQGAGGGPAHSLVIRGASWNWIAAQPLFFRGLAYGDSTSLIACLQMLAVGLAAIIPLGSGSDRWRIGAICASTALFAGITYPLFAHWVWGGGWLSQISHLGMGQGFLDCAGSGTIQVTGGLTALSIAWIIGPRRGKYSHDGMPTAIPGHNSVLVLVGCLIALVGWLALNSAGSLLFAAVNGGRLVLVLINTFLAAFSGLLGALITTRIRFGKPDTSLSANGWVAGLVAISASCAFVVPATAIVIGAIAGILIPFAIDNFEFRLVIDDPGGSISVHAVGGLWGLIAAGLFARVSGSQSGQILAQIIGIATLLGFVFPLTYGLNWALDRIYPQRVAREGERQGMDLHELGADAYPEFAIHTDEFIPR
jgi:ammonium transporter, Amt family